MARRTITECDRCHREIPKGNASCIVKLTLAARPETELCGTCKDKMLNFLAGAELEVPP